MSVIQTALVSIVGSFFKNHEERIYIVKPNVYCYVNNNLYGPLDVRRKNSKGDYSTVTVDFSEVLRFTSNEDLKFFFGENMKITLISSDSDFESSLVFTKDDDSFEIDSTILRNSQINVNEIVEFSCKVLLGLTL